MKVNQVDLIQRVIRLAPGTTKNNEGREVFMTDALHSLLSACVQSKRPEDAVLTRPNGVPVRSFREALGARLLQSWRRSIRLRGLQSAVALGWRLFPLQG